MVLLEDEPGQPITIRQLVLDLTFFGGRRDEERLGVCRRTAMSRAATGLLCVGGRTRSIVMRRRSSGDPT